MVLRQGLIGEALVGGQVHEVRPEPGDGPARAGPGTVERRPHLRVVCREQRADGAAQGEAKEVGRTGLQVQAGDLR